MSMEMKMKRRFYQQHEPERIKISEVSDKESTMPSTAEQIETLEAINEYNQTLPEKKRVNPKNFLPEIMSSNIGVTKRFWKDLAKKKASRQRLYYHQIGIVDGTSASSFSDDKFSIASK